ncbi:SDR family NAD(P)-dependent oxidoreductase [Flavobacteriales bacterium]|nr:SDR family NAD(P)-dependent oxidoreductase [Flavobacteriales bacterium]
MRKVAIVSGASRGLGRTIAIRLAEAGYDLAIASRSIGALNELKHTIEQKYSVKVLTEVVDFSDKKSIDNFTTVVNDNYPVVDIIVNNIGIYGGSTVSEMGDLQKMMNTNFYSAVSLTSAFLTAMQEAQHGHVFNICSIVNRHPRFMNAAYTISKDALFSYSKVLREEMRDYGVKVSAILPGAINTSSWDGIEAPRDEMVQPEDVANAIMYALSLSKHAYMEEIVIRQMRKDL